MFFFCEKDPSQFGGGDKCARCNKTVYFAEERKGAGKKWHVECFKCLTCGKRLDSTTLLDGDGEIYCKADYAKKFGPKGFGIGGGTATHTQ